MPHGAYNLPDWPENGLSRSHTLSAVDPSHCPLRYYCIFSTQLIHHYQKVGATVPKLLDIDLDHNCEQFRLFIFLWGVILILFSRVVDFRQIWSSSETRELLTDFSLPLLCFSPIRYDDLSSGCKTSALAQSYQNFSFIISFVCNLVACVLFLHRPFREVSN